jgi:hypothetical protein|nr:MAG TPA: hypothetical protein [Bacteriophage sp.]
MKLKTSNASLYGSRLTVPVDGTIQIDRNGEINVSEACARHLLTLPEWAVVGKATKEDEVPAAEPAEDQDKTIIDQIRAMSLEEMLETAAEAEYPEDEYKKFKKNAKLMAAYLVKKYKAAVAVEE